MEWWKILLIYLAVVAVFAVIHGIGKSKKPIKRAFLSTFLGFLSLVAINLFSPLTGAVLPISLLSGAVAVIGGVPGVTLMLLFNVLL